MRKLQLFTVGLAFVTVIGGVASCQTKQGTGTLAGAGGGAVLGGIIGNIIGKDSKATAIGAVIGSAVGAGAGTLIGRHMDKVAAEAAAQVQNAKVEEVTDANGLKAVKVTFNNGLLFNVGKYLLQESAKTDLNNFSNVLKNHTDCSVAIQGYASSDGSDEVNLKLSQNRATAVKDYLVNTCGVSPSQIQSTIGYGETNLVMNADGTENVTASRRVEVYLYASQEMINAANNGTLQ